MSKAKTAYVTVYKGKETPIVYSTRNLASAEVLSHCKDAIATAVWDGGNAFVNTEVFKRGASQCVRYRAFKGADARCYDYGVAFAVPYHGGKLVNCNWGVFYDSTDENLLAVYEDRDAAEASVKGFANARIVPVAFYA